MDLCDLPGRFLRFMIITILIVFNVFPKSVPAIDDRYENCRTPFLCGGVNFSYPFWGGERSEDCGYPGFKVECRRDVPEITILDRTYFILSINKASKVASFAIKDYWDNNCPTTPGNSPLNFNIFSYASGTQNITLSYSCPELQSEFQSSPSPYTFSCNSGETNSTAVNYFYTDNAFPSNCSWYFGGCRKNVLVAVSQSTFDAINRDLLSGNLNQYLRGGFWLHCYANDSFCDRCEESNGLCGRTSDTSEFTCYCPDHPEARTCPSEAGGKSFFIRRWKISIGIAAAVVGIIIIITILLIGASRRKLTLDKFVFFHNKKAKNDRIVEAFVRNFGSLAPKKYSYSDVKRMTKSFSNKLGQGGYGDVYKGTLLDGRLVAVKFLKESKGNGEEFMNEVASISRTSHVNIVTLLGFCYECKKQTLIYEFMPNGSLDKFIYDEEPSSINRNLEWKIMNQIAIGIARGLEYLHRGCNTKIVHFDIKPHNILLDEEFCPKISDFGLAKLCKKKESIILTLDARETIWYIAPEIFCRNLGKVSHKSDVYSYGMMILEMVDGRKNVDVGISHTSEIYFPNWIYKQLELGKDFEVHGAVTEEEMELPKKMVLVSLWCIQTIPLDRPSMTRVVEMLEGGLEYLQVPPKPSFASQIRSPQHVSPISSSSLSA